MSANHWAPLLAQLESEIEAIQRLKQEAARILAEAPSEGDPVYTRAAGSVLQDFYNGAERIWRHIATDLDGGLPAGPDWHTRLLDVMSLSIEGTRPPVITKGLASALHEYLVFRDRFRNLYGYVLNWERCRQLLDPLPALIDALAAEVRRFEAFMRLSGADGRSRD